MEDKSLSLRMNVAKTKVVISGCSVGQPLDKDKFFCSVYGKGVGSNSIFCFTWVHKGVVGL